LWKGGELFQRLSSIRGPFVRGREPLRERRWLNGDASLLSSCVRAEHLLSCNQSLKPGDGKRDAGSLVCGNTRYPVLEKEAGQSRLAGYSLIVLGVWGA
jgi:hypothetical protein